MKPNLPPDLAALLDAATHEVAADAVAPQSDLWPAIASRITAQRRSRRAARLRRLAGAAAVVLVVGVVAVRSRPMAPEVATPQLAQAPLRPLETALADLRTDLGQILEDGTLPASAQSAIEVALRDLALERADLVRAAAAAPHDAHLARQLADLDAREASLLHRLHRLARRA
jgi:hypothetical protein